MHVAWLRSVVNPPASLSVMSRYGWSAFQALRSVSEGDVLQNLLAVDWSTFFARDVLQENPRSLQRLRSLFGRDTVAAKELIAAYEPALLSTVQHMMRLQGPPGRPPGQNGPLHFCGTFGWSQ
ncbi:unnamed protein product, partial [Effrenium voratum]